MTSWFDQLTDDARNAMVVAADEARRAHSDTIGTEHLLLALSAPPAATSRLLAEAGASTHLLRRACDQGDVEHESPQHLPLSPHLQAALTGSVGSWISEDATPLDAAGSWIAKKRPNLEARHLLHGILKTTWSTGAQLLASVADVDLLERLLADQGDPA